MITQKKMTTMMKTPRPLVPRSLLLASLVRHHSLIQRLETQTKHIHTGLFVLFFLAVITVLHNCNVLFKVSLQNLRMLHCCEQLTMGLRHLYSISIGVGTCLDNAIMHLLHTRLQPFA